MRLIDADALKEKTSCFVDYQGINLVWDFIDIAPTVDKGYNEGHIDGMLKAEKLYARPIGEWIPINDKRGKEIACVCSACKKNPKYDVHSAYCPNCGAKMEES